MADGQAQESVEQAVSLLRETLGLVDSIDADATPEARRQNFEARVNLIQTRILLEALRERGHFPEVTPEG